MGEIYDNSIALYKLWEKFDTLTEIEIEAFGSALGQLFNMVFYDPEDFETYEESVSSFSGAEQRRRAGPN